MTDDNEQEPARFTKLERYMITNQLRILEALYPDEADHFAVQRAIFEQGYEMLYGWQLDHIYDGQDVMTREECSEVWDTMDMFVSLERAGSQMKFQGYDGNNESKFMAFAAFTVERLERFTHLPMEQPGYWNSHSPVREMYQRMLERWRALPAPGRYRLSAEQVAEIEGRRPHPDAT